MNTLTPCRRCWSTPRPTEGFVRLRWVTVPKSPQSPALVADIVAQGGLSSGEILVAADTAEWWAKRIEVSAEYQGNVVLSLWTVKGKG